MLQRMLHCFNLIIIYAPVIFKRCKTVLPSFGHCTMIILSLKFMNKKYFLQGRVAFSTDGSRIAWTQIEQLVEGKYQKLGFYDFLTGNLTWLNQEKWIGRKKSNSSFMFLFLQFEFQGTKYHKIGQ